MSDLLLGHPKTREGPPLRVVDLEATAVAGMTVTLEWIAPADFEGGTVSAYDMRYSTSPITDANFGAASQATGEPTPGDPGDPETMDVGGLDAETLYYFAMKSRDDEGLWSAVSNNASETTGSIYVQDSFTDTPATALAGHTPEIAPLGWVWAPYRESGPTNPAFVIDAAGTRMNPVELVDGVFRGYQGDAEQADVKISVDFEANSINPSWPGVVGRYEAPGDKWLAWWDAESGNINLVDPTGATVDTAALVLGVSDQARITLTMLGTSITALFENLTDVTSDTLSATSALNQAATRVGISCRATWNPAFDFFDNFLVVVP